MNWLDKISLPIILIVALPLMIAPYPMQPTPHLIEKITMLMNGQLTQWIDIGDLLLHGLPAFVLAMKLARIMTRERPAEAR